MNQDLQALAAGTFPHRATAGFDALYGLEFLEATRDLARARIELRPELLQPMGLLHGGVIAAVAESLASMATAREVVPDGLIVMGLSNVTSFLRPVTQGHVEAVARRIHSGRTTWLWDVEFLDADGRRCAVTRMTIAVRPRPESGSGGASE